jgi:hypothetical protein
VEVHEARAVLGVLATDDWPAVRLAYRKLIRELHPDRAGERTTGRAAELNEAYAVLNRVLHDASTAPRRPGPPPPPTHSGTRITGRIDEGHTLILSVPPEEAFTRLLDAGHVIGHVSYVDRSSAIFEVVVQHNGEACSLVVSLEPHRDGAEALCTMESIERVFQPAPEPVVRQLLAAIRTPWVSGPSPSSS